MTVFTTYSFRLRSKHDRALNRKARAVNYVWNYCNETQRKAAQANRRWLSHFDLTKLTSGATKELGIHADTVGGAIHCTSAGSRATAPPTRLPTIANGSIAISVRAASRTHSAHLRQKLRSGCGLRVRISPAGADRVRRVTLTYCSRSPTEQKRPSRVAPEPTNLWRDQMPKFAIKHQESDDELDPKELVGSKDLRESFQDGQRVRGSFYLNGVHFHNFEANSPASIVAGINAKSASTGIKASIDDGGHLVLLNSSQMDIRIKLGAVYDEPASVSTGNVADDVVKMLKADRDIREGDHNDKRNNVLEQLGLEANEDDSQIAANRPGFETGMTAEQRADARANGNVTGDETAYSNNPSAPVTGAEGGKLRDGNDRSGTGYGYSPQPDGTPAVPGTPQNPGGGRNANPNAPRQSPPSRI